MLFSVSCKKRCSVALLVMRDLSDVRVTLVICKKMTLSLYSNVDVDFVILLSPIQLTVIKLMTRRLHGQLPSLATDE